MDKIAIKWADFQEKISTTMNFWRFFAVGVALIPLGVFGYVKNDESMYLVVMVLGLSIASQALARYGFTLKIRELKKRLSERDESDA